MQIHIHITCEYRLNELLSCSAPQASARSDLKYVYAAGLVHARPELQLSTQILISPWQHVEIVVKTRNFPTSLMQHAAKL